ncbi:hypothetical protein JJJ17_15490 [Paracoccus caeni]|uniref:Uncharacterized protein n=1 Tax=Paracoccus caeni TaxID=657651 RepID=A0A934SN14_9RHOB|nr:hypothetical protein [Paracoccus caeni]MBK4217333.1 hypothetical protein [Paracoccus caeni]
MKHILFLGLALSLTSIFPTDAKAQDRSRLVQCKLVVDGQEFIGSQCRFTPQGRDGSFMIMSGNGQYFAMVSIDQPGRATGFWNEEPYANHAHTGLGTLTQQDACWVNERASVCAW